MANVSFPYNNATCVVSIEERGNSYVLVAKNVTKGIEMDVSNPIQDLDEAISRAKRFAGVYEPLDPDAVEQYLSERLGF